MAKWVGVDLDGCLAYDLPDGKYVISEIGEPVPGMLAIIKQHLANGDEVRIFTARASLVDHWTIFDGTANEYLDLVTETINEWCMKHIGVVLPVTSEKDYKMSFFYDDRARQVLRNKGIVVS